MKKVLHILSICMIAASFSGLMPQSAQAGPPPGQYVLKPVKTQAQLDALEAGTKIAVTCPDCGTVMVSKVAKDRSNLQHFDCPVCKHSFALVTLPGGKASQAQLLCKDSKGHKMPLKLCAEMHK